MKDIQLTYSPFDLLNQTAVRNLQVRAFWYGLSYTRKTRLQKFDIIEQEFHLKHKSIEKIIYDLPKNK